MSVRLPVLLIAVALGFPAWADDSEPNFNQIKEIDLSEEHSGGPKAANASNHIVLMLNLNKVKSGTLGQVILYQFAKRVRLEFEADGLPKGEYVLAAAAKCSPAQYGKAWTELHRFKSESRHIQTEKSLPKASLRDEKPGLLVLSGKSLGLFRMNPAQLIDCKTVE